LQKKQKNIFEGGFVIWVISGHLSTYEWSFRWLKFLKNKKYPYAAKGLRLHDTLFHHNNFLTLIFIKDIATMLRGCCAWIVKDFTPGVTQRYISPGYAYHLLISAHWASVVCRLTVMHHKFPGLHKCHPGIKTIDIQWSLHSCIDGLSALFSHWAIESLTCFNCFPPQAATAMYGGWERTW
jgi:hypothetical protein